MQMQARQLWQAVLGDMQTRLPRNAFDNWLRPTVLVAFENDVATVAAPNPFGAPPCNRAMPIRSNAS